MQRKNRRRTRAHLLKTLHDPKIITTPFIRQYRHSLADKMLAIARKGTNANELRESEGTPAATARA